MDRIFEFIIKATIYGSISGILIWVTQILLKENLRPKWSYLLWSVLIVKLIIPFGPESNFSIFNKFDNKYLYSIQHTKLIKEFNNLTEICDMSNYNNTNQPTDNSTTEIINTHSKTDNFFPNKNERNFNISIFKKYICNLWFIISINIFVFINFSYILLNFQLSKHIIDVDVKLYSILQSSKNKLNINKNVQIVVNDYINSPALSGIFNPKILLPLDMLSLSVKELDYIFLHELSHYKRKDNLVNYILIFIQSIHWFNPLIWFFFNKIRENMELATDEIVLNVLNKNEYRDYGLTLLSVLSKFKKNTFQPGLIGMAKNKKNVEKRIMNIKFMKNSKTKKIVFSLIGVLVISLSSTVLLTSSKNGTQIVYGNNKKQSSPIYNLSELQNTFFKLSELKKANKNITRNEIKKSVNYLKLRKTESLDDNEQILIDRYANGNEELRVYYFQEGTNYVAKHIWYYLNDENNDLYSIRLHSTDNINGSENLGVEFATNSTNILDTLSKDLNISKTEKTSYETYLKVLKKLEAKESFKLEDLLKIDQNFTEAVTEENIVKVTSNDNELVAKFNNSNGELQSIGFGDVYNLNAQKETLWTKTKNFPENDFIIKEYNFPQEKSSNVLNKFEDNIKSLKESFTKIMNTYSYTNKN